VGELAAALLLVLLAVHAVGRLRPLRLAPLRSCAVCDVLERPG
jgi:hypothetical protein